MSICHFYLFNDYSSIVGIIAKQLKKIYLITHYRLLFPSKPKDGVNHSICIFDKYTDGAQGQFLKPYLVTLKYEPKKESHETQIHLHQ